MALTIDVPPLIAFFPPHLAVLEVCAGRPGDVEVFAESRWERGVLHLQQIGVRAVLVAAVYRVMSSFFSTDYQISDSV